MTIQTEQQDNKDLDDRKPKDIDDKSNPSDLLHNPISLREDLSLSECVYPALPELHPANDFKRDILGKIMSFAIFQIVLIILSLSPPPLPFPINHTPSLHTSWLRVLVNILTLLCCYFNLLSQEMKIFPNHLPSSIMRENKVNLLHTLTSAHTHTCTHSYTYSHACTHPLTYTHTQTHIHNAHTFAHTCTHTHTLARTCITHHTLASLNHTLASVTHTLTCPHTRTLASHSCFCHLEINPTMCGAQSCDTAKTFDHSTQTSGHLLCTVICSLL